MQIKETEIPGCMEIRPQVHADSRGTFVKTLHRALYHEYGLEYRFDEEYWSRSKRGVIRGLHFQRPPSEHTKLVYCVQGEVLDAVVDLRIGSPAYGSHITRRLDGERATVLYLPAGLAHGFCTISDTATLVYKTSTVHDPENDTGVRWDSAGIDWPCSTPCVSDRDRALIPMCEFESPFRYQG